MTNQRKIFGALLILAASAFGVDHWWLGSGQTPAELPAPAPVGPVVTHSSPRRSGAPARNTSQIAAKPAPHRTLAGRLLEAARAEEMDDEDETSGVPDAFRPSSVWYPAAAAATVAVAAPVIGPEKIAEFRGRHRLTAVMKSSRPGSPGGLAIIGGKVYVPGQTIDGFTLDSLGERTAQLSCKGVTVILAIDPPDALTSLSGQ